MFLTYQLFLLLFPLIFLNQASNTKGQEATCDLPFYYDDEYEIAGRDKLHINSTLIVDYPLNIPGTSRRNFGCLEKHGNIYILKGTENVDIFNQLITLYMCLEIHQVSNAAYYYYYKTGYALFYRDYIYGSKTGHPPFDEVCAETTNEKAFIMIAKKGYALFYRDYIYGSKTGHPPFDEVCAETTDEKAFIMIAKKGSYEENLLNTKCPQDILAVFDNVNITSSYGTTTTGCPGTRVDVCTNRTTVALNYNSTCYTAKMASRDGKYSCLFSMTLGSDTYLGLWNQDTMVDGSNTFRFSCFAYSVLSGVLYATETPTACTSTTTSTNLGSATEGVTVVVWKRILKCQDRVNIPVISESMVDITWLYYLGTGLGIALICVRAACLFKMCGCVCLNRKSSTWKIEPMCSDTN